MVRAPIVQAVILTILTAGQADAHDAAQGGSGFMHAVGSADHLTGFLIIGGMSGLYIHLNGGRPFVFGSIFALVLLASQTHASVTGETGIIFAMGFIGAGLFAAIAASELVMTLLAKSGLRRPRGGED